MQSNARINPELSQRQASIARRISSKYKIRMPYNLRMVFCKKCKSFIAPGINSRIRLGRTSVKSIEFLVIYVVILIVKLYLDNLQLYFNEFKNIQL